MAAAEAMQDVRRSSIRGDATHRLLPAAHPLNLAVHWSTHPLQRLNRHRRMVAFTAVRQHVLLRSRGRHGLSQVWSPEFEALIRRYVIHSYLHPRSHTRHLIRLHPRQPHTLLRTVRT